MKLSIIIETKFPSHTLSLNSTLACLAKAFHRYKRDLVLNINSTGKADIATPQQCHVSWQCFKE